MKKIILLVTICLLLRPAFAQQTEYEKLQAFFKNYLEQHFGQKPLDATALGDHRFDAQLDDISPEARAAWQTLDKQTLANLSRQVDYKKLPRDGQIDYEILRDELTYQMWVADNMQPFERDPRTYGGYLSDSVYLLLTQSTQPKEINISNAISRIAQMPRIVAEAKRSLNHPSKPILETAIRQNAGAIKFYEDEIFRYAGETSQQKQLEAAAASAVTLLKDYQQFLEGPARARAEDNWRLGKTKFAQKFVMETDAGVTADQNLAAAKAEFDRVETEMYIVSRQLWPQYFSNEILPADDPAGRRETITKVINAVDQEHGEVSNLVADAHATVDTIKAFIRAHNYLQLPDPDRCQVVEMPEFRRGNSLAYLDNAPPLDPEAPSVYAVSPPPADWSAQEIRSFLEEYNSHMLKILTIHEAYPGHYVQLEYANQNPSLIRRVFQSGPYVEGWAVYGEVTMLNEGFGGGDLRLRLMQLKFYLRAVANSILDYQMHCTKMTDEEAMKFLTQDAFQSEGEAKLKVIRAKQSAVQLSTYFVGRMAHYNLHQAIQSEMGDKFNLSRYHMAVLATGSIPPKYLPETVRRNLAMSP